MSTTSLPAGATCGSCHFFAVCRSRFHRLPEDTECEHAPSLYRAALPIANRHGVPSPPSKPRRKHERPIRHISNAEPERVKLLEGKRPRGRFRFGSGAYQMVLTLEAGR